MVKADFGKWHVECLPEDGARISILKYCGNDLLTPCSSNSKKPEKDYGEFELRPVYGYDDCFPTVDKCIYPAGNYNCGDHGELYGQKWDVSLNSFGLICSVNCIKPEITFLRSLKFDSNHLIWSFKVRNRSNKPLPFLHVMHPLMQLNLESVDLPGFKGIYDEFKSEYLKLRESREVNDYLQKIKNGDFKMLILNNLESGKLGLKFKNGITLKIQYDVEAFPSLGIWYNYNGYPDEDGLRRKECAFEPIPGTCSNLEQSYKDGVCLSVKPFGTYSWKIKWSIN